MKLTLEKAKELLQNNSHGKMVERKVQHCLEVGRVARKIAEKCGLDGEKAEILGIIHDIGDLEISSDNPIIEKLKDLGDQHPYVGYKYLKILGYDDEYANICLTHSFLHGDPNCTADGLIVRNGKVKDNKIIPYKNEEDSKFVLDFLKNHKYTKIEDIINLCDLMVTDKVIGLDTRLIDLIGKKGAHITTKYHIAVARDLKQEIEKEMGCNMLDLLPEIFENQKAKDTYRSGMTENYKK